MPGHRHSLPALLLTLALSPSALAQQVDPTPTATPQGPIGSVAPTPGAPPAGGAPNVPSITAPAATPPTAPAASTPAAAAAPATAAPAAPGTTPPAATPPAAPAAPKAPAGPPGAGPDRLDFTLKFADSNKRFGAPPPPRRRPATDINGNPIAPAPGPAAPAPAAASGGGSASGSAANLEYKREDYAVLSGEVQLQYQDLDLKADEVEIDLGTKDVIATGNVILDEGPRRLAGDSLTFNLEAKTGVIRHATGQVTPDYYFSGEEVDKTGPNSYVIKEGVFTSCSQQVPDWSFRVKEAEIEVEGYAHAHHATMRVKKVPVFYTPYLLWPVLTERSSGFLIPQVGYSQLHGAELGLAYFQTLGRSYDTTFHLDTFSKNFLGIGDEFRYAPTAGTKGDFLGYAIRDNTGEWEYKLQLTHTTDDLPYGMRGGISFQKFSDFEFFRTFERDFDTNTLRTIASRGFITGNWGANLVNLLFDSRETFLDVQDDTLVQRHLPELEYRLRSTQLGKTPFYLELDSSASYLDVARPQSYQGQYGRFDLFPQLTLPVKTFPWLNVSLTGGERLTYYGDTLDTTQTKFTGDSLTRTFPFASAEIVGPSFSKIFSFHLGDLGKFKHIIEPRITYTYQGDLPEKDATAIALFDEVDSQVATNTARIAIDNRLLGKPDTENGVSREILFFEIARNYGFDPLVPLQSSADGLTTTTQGPLEALLRFNPTQKLSVTVSETYNTLFKGVASTGFTGSYQFAGNDSLAATWFTNSDTENNIAASDQVRLSGVINVPAWHLLFEGQINYDFQQHLLQQDQIAMTYNSQCYGLRFEFRDFNSGAGTVVSDREIRFSLTLKNVGTFLDLTSRSSTVLP
jgi:LPS-assembly protein